MVSRFLATLSVMLRLLLGMERTTMHASRLWTLAFLMAWCAPSSAQDRRALHYEKRVAAFKAQNKTLAPDKRHVVLVGDSLTERWLWKGRTNRYLPNLVRSVLNRGITADRVGPPRGVLSRMDASIFDTKPSHVVLLVGVNQVKAEGGVPRAARDYEEIVSRVRKRLPDVELIAVSTPPTRDNYAAYQEDIVAYNAKVKEIAKRHGARFLDLHALLEDAEGKLKKEVSADGIHFNDAGYAIFGKALQAMIKLEPTPEKTPASRKTPAPTPGTKGEDGKR